MSDQKKMAMNKVTVQCCQCSAHIDFEIPWYFSVSAHILGWMLATEGGLCGDCWRRKHA